METFWDRLPKPFFVLAPMADVTDAAFRRVIAAHGKPDVTWTEFVSADGLVRATEEGKKKLLADLMYIEAERPIVAQLFSSNPEHMEQAARLCVELGFDGIDINMGCPVGTIVDQGAGAAHIKDPDRAIEVIKAAQRGAGTLPVSVKTRLGYNTDILEEWLPKILSTGVAAVTIHARTRKEMSKVPARWERVQRAVEIRDALQGKPSAYPPSGRENQRPTLILGNGDVTDLADARRRVAETGADGAMLGRAIFGNPWRFNHEKDISEVPLAERLAVMVEHTKLFEQLLPHKSFAIMKKHYKAYVTGFDGAAEVRAELMDAPDAAAVAAVVSRFLQSSMISS